MCTWGSQAASVSVSGTLLSFTHCYGIAAAVCSHSGEKKANWGGTSLFLESFLSDVGMCWQSGNLGICKSRSVRGRDEREPAWQCSQWWSAQLQSLIAPGNRSHFPNHIHTPSSISSLALSSPLFLSPAVLRMPLSISHICLCSEFTILQ